MKEKKGAKSNDAAGISLKRECEQKEKLLNISCKMSLVEFCTRCQTEQPEIHRATHCAVPCY